MLPSILLALLSLAPGSPARATSGGETHPVPVAALEVAPGHLGSARSPGQLVLGASEDGKTIYLLDDAGRLTAYREKGERIGDTVVLHADSFSLAEKPFWCALGASEIAVATPLDVTLFKLDGSHVAQRRGTFLANSIASLPTGDWGLGLMQPPKGPHFALSDDANAPRPRLVSLEGRDLEVDRTGLFAADDERSMSAAAGRALRVVAGGGHIYALEFANYKIYRLSPAFKLLATLSDRALQLEQGRPATDGGKEKAEKDARMRLEAEKLFARSGRDAARPSAPQRMEGGSFTYTTVVRAAAWDRRSGRLLLLLDKGIAGSTYALDLLDPGTGERNRLMLRAPDVAADVHQLVVGYDYIWLRGRPGGTATLRLDRSALERAKAVGKLDMK